jgi:hypothetical protein
MFVSNSLGKVYREYIKILALNSTSTLFLKHYLSNFLSTPQNEDVSFAQLMQPKVIGTYKHLMTY